MRLKFMISGRCAAIVSCILCAGAGTTYFEPPSLTWPAREWAGLPLCQSRIFGSLEICHRPQQAKDHL